MAGADKRTSLHDSIWIIQEMLFTSKKVLNKKYCSVICKKHMSDNCHAKEFTVHLSVKFSVFDGCDVLR